MVLPTLCLPKRKNPCNSCTVQYAAPTVTALLGRETECAARHPFALRRMRVDRGYAGRYTSACVSGSSSVVECFLAKEDVAGSTPVSRSITSPSAIHSSYNQPGVR